MPNYRRVYVNGSWYFFTVVTHHRQPILCTDIGCNSLRTAVERTRATFPFKTVAWVLLPDHLHCIWQMPENDSDFSTRWRLIKTHFTRAFIRHAGTPAIPLSLSRERHKEHAVWQRRFWEHCLRDEEDLNRHIAYIHRNPVKHGLVATSKDWPYSTVHRSGYKNDPVHEIAEEEAAKLELE